MDTLTIAKSLGGVIPIGVVIVKDKITSSFRSVDYGTINGSNPVTCAVKIANINFTKRKFSRKV